MSGLPEPTHQQQHQSITALSDAHLSSSVPTLGRQGTSNHESVFINKSLRSASTIRARKKRRFEKSLGKCARRQNNSMFSQFYQRSKTIPAEACAAGTRRGTSAPRARIGAFAELPLRLNWPRLILARALMRVA